MTFSMTCISLHTNKSMRLSKGKLSEVRTKEEEGEKTGMNKEVPGHRGEQPTTWDRVVGESPRASVSHPQNYIYAHTSSWSRVCRE